MSCEYELVELVPFAGVSVPLNCAHTFVLNSSSSVSDLALTSSFPAEGVCEAPSFQVCH